MSVAGDTSQFLVEWYWPDATADRFDKTVARLVGLAASACAAGNLVQLLVTFLVPGDEVAFGVFDASSADSVSTLCGLAGAPAQRLTPVGSTRFLFAEM